jgi:hypothetical protein
MAHSPNQLLAQLAEYRGSVEFYYNPLFPLYQYTEGIKFLAEKAEAYWFLDFIFSHQLNPEIRQEVFQTWNIKVEDSKGTVQVEDGNENVIATFEIPFTDFLLPDYTVWFVNRVLLLKSEY